MSEPFITTASGRNLFFDRPHPDQIDIGDIARGLATEFRWCGQGPRWITVAEHSVAAAVAANYRGLGPRVAVLSLLHDAHEFAMKDMPTHLKRSLAEYTAVADRLQAAILAALKVEPPTEAEAESVHRIDLDLRTKEVMEGFAPAGLRLDGMVMPGQLPGLIGMVPEGARQNFIYAWQALTDPENRRA
jgi:hypothetical protein